jgi:lysophospholipase L1-like esterase
MTKLRRFARAGRFALLSGALALACSKNEASSAAGNGGSHALSGGVGGANGNAANRTAGSSGGLSANGTSAGSGGVGGDGAPNGGTSAAPGRQTGGRAGASSGGGRGMLAGGSAGTRAAQAGSSATSGSAGRLGAGGAMAGAGGSASAGTGTGEKSGGSGGSAGSVGAGALKIMAIGDSTTQATCWRALLWQTLNAKHAGHFDFVGSHRSDIGCSPSNYDQDNEAYGSSLLSEAVSGLFANNRMCTPLAPSGPCPKLNDFITAFQSYKPDVALIHYGTNDVWNSIATSSIMAGFDDLVNGLRAANAGVKIFVAQIIPMNVTDAECGGCGCSACTSNIAALNSAIATWAPMHSTAGSPIGVVDQNTGFDAVADTRDGVHPNDSGSQKMAAKWDAALEPLF